MSNFSIIEKVSMVVDSIVEDILGKPTTKSFFDCLAYNYFGRNDMHPDDFKLRVDEIVKRFQEIRYEGWLIDFSIEFLLDNKYGTFVFRTLSGDVGSLDDEPSQYCMYHTTKGKRLETKWLNKTGFKKRPNNAPAVFEAFVPFDIPQYVKDFMKRDHIDQYGTIWHYTPAEMYQNVMLMYDVDVNDSDRPFLISADELYAYTLYGCDGFQNSMPVALLSPADGVPSLRITRGAIQRRFSKEGGMAKNPHRIEFDSLTQYHDKNENFVRQEFENLKLYWMFGVEEHTFTQGEIDGKIDLQKIDPFGNRVLADAEDEFIFMTDVVNERTT